MSCSWLCGKKGKVTINKGKTAPAPPRITQRAPPPPVQDNVRQSAAARPSEDSVVAAPSLIVPNGRVSEDYIDIPIGEERRAGVPLPAQTEEQEVEIVKHPKSDEDYRLIELAIKSNEFLNKIIKDQMMKEVIDAMYKREIRPNEIIVKEGEPGFHMYVSARGTYQVSIQSQGIVTTFENQRVFGELAILYNAKRNASIKATKKGKVWVLDRPVYQKLRVLSQIKEEDEMLEFLQKAPKFKNIPAEALQKVSTLLKTEFFAADTPIVTEGDDGDKFYIIRAGTVTISTQTKGPIGTLTKGDNFGELALFESGKRQATVTAKAPGVECFTLERQHFKDHFGKNIEDIKTVVQPVTMAPTSEYQDVDFSEWVKLKTLGVGGFGRVELVQHRTNKAVICALKYLKKVDMVNQEQQEHLVNEKTIQMSCTSKFIVRLHRSYKDPKYIYFLMESCLGGDLWTLLQRQKIRRFPEKDARFFAACVIEAFAYLHERGLVYRDLKPENILIDEKGYLKLTDFGFAKKLSGKTFTFAGTPEYVAPEVVMMKGHDKAVDYWAFGAFIFELLTGRTPFKTNDSKHIKTYQKILEGIDSVTFPQYVTHSAKNIIEKLCKPVPAHRLGCQRNGVKDVKGHQWFLGFDWVALNEGRLVPPFKPKLSSNTDTKYFESFKEDKDNPPDDLNGWEDF